MSASGEGFSSRSGDGPNTPNYGTGRPSALDLSLRFNGHNVRMVGTPEAPEWIASDVCAVLELRESNPWRHLPDGCKGKVNSLTPGGWQKVVTITEEGLYRLIARSRVPQAEEFRRKVFGEVLPSIRKFGCYPPPAPTTNGLSLDLRDVRVLAPVALQLANLAMELQAETAILRPKAECYDRLSSAKGLSNLQEAGKATSLGPNRLVCRLIDEGVLFRGRHGKPEPKQEHIEAGRFVVKVRERDGHQFVQTLVTPKGLQWLCERYPLPVQTSTQARGLFD